MSEQQILLDLEKYTDTQIITFHRQYLLSHGEFVDEMIRRGFSEPEVETIGKLNITLRNPELSEVNYVH